MSWLDMIKKGVHNVDTVHIGTKTIIGVVCKILFAFQGKKKNLQMEVKVAQGLAPQM